MPPKLPWLPFYGRDFYLDEKVRLLSLRQEAIYLRLLWLQWEEGSIPEVAACQSLPEFRVPLYEDRQSTNAQPELDAEVEHVHLACFQSHPTLSERFINLRLEKVRAEQIEKTDKIHNRALKGGLALAQLKQSLSTAQAKLKPSGSSAIQSQKQIEKKIKSLKSSEESEKSVLHAKVQDRTTRGFESLGEGLAEAVLNIMPKDLKS